MNNLQIMKDAEERMEKAAEVFRNELNEKVLELRRLSDGLVGQRVVRDRLGTSDLVDPDDERLEGVDPALRADVQEHQPHRDERDAQERNLQVRVQHQRGAVQLDVLAFGILQRWQLISERSCHTHLVTLSRHA